MSRRSVWNHAISTSRSRVLNRLLTAVFEGSTEGLVMTLLDGRKLSKAEADRIRALIEQAEEGKP